MSNRAITATFLVSSFFLLLATGCGNKKDPDPSDKAMRVSVEVTGMT